MQAPAEALDLTASYVRICGSGIFFIVAYNMLSALFRGLGDSRSPLIFVLVACIVNVIGDLVLVAGFHLDAAGAAIATVAAQAVSVICAIAMLLKKELPFKIHRSDFKLNPQCEKISGHRSAAGFAGVFDPAFLSGALRFRQPVGAGGIFRLRCGVQDR